MTSMTTKRFTSVDILRGLAITIMILGNLSPDGSVTYPQLLHKEWEGINLIDLAFPSFVFIMGLSMVFSRSFLRDGWFKKVLKRSTILFILGLILNHLAIVLPVLFNSDYTLSQCYTELVANFRPLGVLQRLALVYLIGSIIYRMIPYPLLLGITAFVFLGFSTLAYHFYNWITPYGMENNISIYIDQLTLGTAHTYCHGPFDPEGLFGTINALATLLLGIVTGNKLKPGPSFSFINASPSKKLFRWGITLLIIGGLWSYLEIISKPLWTAPYVMIVAGINIILLSFLEKSGNFTKMLLHPLKAMGQNPLFIYLLTEIGVIVMYSIPHKGEPIYLWLYHTYFFNAANPFVTTFLYTLFWLGICIIIAAVMQAKNWIIKL